jgi:sugar/nucleoside kinase (ribokinase family)
MEHWITGERAALLKLLGRVNILILTGTEARLLAGEHNLVRAGRALLAMGPRAVIVTRGECGALKLSAEGLFALPAFPVDEVADPTGAGDAFAGALVGYVARAGKLNEDILRTAVAYGSVLGSFTVERFSLDGLTELSWEDIDTRYRALIELTDLQHSRWTSR